MPSLTESLRGVLLGTAVGDALGLPAEGLSPRTIRRLGWSPWRHRLVAGRGMLSDDTEHTALVARSLLEHPADADAFQRALARRLRWWLLALPAGVGLATARAILKLWIGFSPARSGVRSAGNGAAMRCAVIGVFFHDRPDELIEYVRRATELTHTDPRALCGAMAVALAAAHGARGAMDAGAFLAQVRELEGAEDEWLAALDRLEDGLARGLSVPALAGELDLSRGVTGYVNHTVPVALYSWLRHPGDFEAALSETLDCGGDADTTGAIVGAMMGASVGARGIPTRWVHGIVDVPVSVGYLRELASALTAALQNKTISRPRHGWWLIPLRNMVFLFIVLAHGFLRLAPARLRRLLSL